MQASEPPRAPAIITLAIFVGANRAGISIDGNDPGVWILLAVQLISLVVGGSSWFDSFKHSATTTGRSAAAILAIRLDQGCIAQRIPDRTVGPTTCDSR